MTRPGFLVITLVACGLGFAFAHWRGHDPSPLVVIWVTGVALLMHAWANVLNDYHDACSGADAANTHGLFPFTGGARLIQNGEVTVAQTRALAMGLAGVTLPLALGLTVWLGSKVMCLGLVGAFLGWAYSSPPLRLMTRGAGECTVGMVWALIVIGSETVAHPGWDGAVLWVAAGYGMLIANILLINAWPDAPADASVGKRTAVVCLGVRRAAQMYGVLWLSAYAVVAWAVAQDALPPQAGWVGVSVPTGVFACVSLWRHAHAPARLRPAIVCTIGTAILYGVALAFACGLNAPR